MREAGEKADQARDRDDRPAHAARLQQNRVHLVDLPRHARELGLHMRDLLLEHGQPLGRRTARGHGRLQIVRAIFSSEPPPT